MTKDILCDLDGTLSDATHRMHLINTNSKHWKEFFDQGIQDKPYEDVLWLLHTLYMAGNTIIFVTARPESEREKTELWLNQVAGLDKLYEKIYMRDPGDYRDDYVVKRDMLKKIYNDGYDPFLVLDDRSNVVQMWRNEGLSCFQVRGHD